MRRARPCLAASRHVGTPPPKNVRWYSGKPGRVAEQLAQRDRRRWPGRRGDAEVGEQAGADGLVEAELAVLDEAHRGDGEHASWRSRRSGSATPSSPPRPCTGWRRRRPGCARGARPWRTATDTVKAPRPKSERCSEASKAANGSPARLGLATETAVVGANCGAPGRAVRAARVAVTLLAVAGGRVGRRGGRGGRRRGRHGGRGGRASGSTTWWCRRPVVGGSVVVRWLVAATEAGAAASPHVGTRPR